MVLAGSGGAGSGSGLGDEAESLGKSLVFGGCEAFPLFKSSSFTSSAASLLALVLEHSPVPSLPVSGFLKAYTKYVLPFAKGKPQLAVLPDVITETVFPFAAPFQARSTTNVMGAIALEMLRPPCARCPPLWTVPSNTASASCKASTGVWGGAQEQAWASGAE